MSAGRSITRWLTIPAALKALLVATSGVVAAPVLGWLAACALDPSTLGGLLVAFCAPGFALTAGVARACGWRGRTAVGIGALATLTACSLLIVVAHGLAAAGD